MDKTFIKRSLRSQEWQVSKFQGTIHVPRQGKERILNEAACLKFIKAHSDIPVPNLHCSFEDDGAVYLIMDYVDGVGMNSLNESERVVVTQELERHLHTLRGLRSSKIGGPAGHIILPYRASRITFRDNWNLQSSETDEYVFCHNDLSQHNVIVEPDSLKIAAIIDWEYAGFYPAFFERRFFERIGPSVVADGEQDDSQTLVEFIEFKQ